jgi:Ca2+-binding EF-hand superfamily protein
MESFALRQIEKINKAKEEEAASLKKYVAETGKMTEEQQEALNVSLGLPPKPPKPNSHGKNGAAAIWWDYPVSKRTLKELTGWKVVRYRRDPMIPNSPWSNKGDFYTSTLDILQVQINDLTNEYEYRFAVAAKNDRGYGLESVMSDPVIVEAPLPPGWFRFWSEEHLLYYFANIKTRQSSWDRPERDPWFVAEGVKLNFTDRELAHMRSLFEEDIAHFGNISQQQFYDHLAEFGEIGNKKKIAKLYKTFATMETFLAKEFSFDSGNQREFKNETMYEKQRRIFDQKRLEAEIEKGGSSFDKIEKWSQYLNIINGVKMDLQKPVLIVESVNWCCALWKKRAASSIISFNENDVLRKLGDWSEEWSSVADKRYYKNKSTGEITWDMPDEVRFYLPKTLEDQLLTVFNFGQIQAFREAFNALDMDRSGELTIDELKLFFNLLKIEVSKVKFDMLVKVVDANNNGTVEFDEFCFMLFEFSHQHKDKRTNKWLGIDFTEILGPDYEAKIAMSNVNQNVNAMNAGNRERDASLAKRQLSARVNKAATGISKATAKPVAVAQSPASSPLKSSKVSPAYAAARKKEEKEEEEDDWDEDEYGEMTRKVKVHSKFCFCGCRGRKDDF